METGTSLPHFRVERDRLPDVYVNRDTGAEISVEQVYKRLKHHTGSDGSITQPADIVLWTWSENAMRISSNTRGRVN